MLRKKGSLYATDSHKRAHFEIKRKEAHVIQQAIAFEPASRPLPKVNPTVVPVARKRLQRKAVAILERLKAGEATNAELAQIGGFRFGARLGEIREHLRWRYGIGKAWDPIHCKEDKATGLAVYRLVEAYRLAERGEG